MKDRLEPDAAREILRRAAEIESERRAAAPDFALEALEQAAAEVGISAEAVQRAVAEHDVGGTTPAAKRRHLLGPADVRAIATLEIPKRDAEARITAFLRSQLLTVSRRSPGSLEWSARSDLAARVRRRVDFGKQIRLDGVDRVVVSVGEAGEGRSLIRIDADFEATRRGLRMGTTGAAIGMPVAGGALSLIVGDPTLFVAGFPVGAAFGTAGVYVSRKVLATQRDEAQRVIELFLAELGPT